MARHKGTGPAYGFPALVHQPTGTTPRINDAPQPQTVDATGARHAGKLLGKVSATTIAKRLKRTETSVVMKVKSIGHSRPLDTHAE
jgi:hypothetical protein